MDGILFRGKPKTHPNMPEREKDWVFGSHLFLRANGGKHYILTGEVYIGTLNPVKVEVDPESIGQYTSKNSYDGFMVFEHDLVRLHSANTDEDDGTFEVLWDHENARFVADRNGLCYDLGDFWDGQIEVVGNTYENPELLEGM